MLGKTALIVGASGLVGSRCLQELLRAEGYSRIVALVRNPLPVSHPKLSQQAVDFERIEEHRNALKGDDLFYCLGTTRDKAGSNEAFRRIDLGYAERVARIASENGVRQFLLVSSQGADAGSAIFYLRVKGELEKIVTQMPFQSVHLFRPSLLLGLRPVNRPVENLAAAFLRIFAFFFQGPLAKYRPVRAEKVAEAMVAVAARESPGVHVYEASFLR